VHALRTLNVISPPAAPTGETSGLTEATYTYSTTGGSISLAGGAVQYRFIWGDGESTDWLEEDVKSAEHSWAETGTYAVTVEARSVLTDTVTSNASDERSVSMTFDENVTVQFSDGPETGEISVDYEFSFTGESDYGHDLEFQVDWGDGNVSEWAAFNSAEGESLTNAWDNLGDWPVVVTLRCAEHYSVTFSAEQSISIVEETIDTPTIDGPSTGEVGAEYTFTVDGNSSAGHDLQYFFNWGDGSDSGWIAFGSGVTSAEVSHEWGSAGAFGIEVGVRCATHDYLEAWSDSHAIEISPQPNEELTGPSVESSWDGYIDASNSFTLSTSSNLGHELEYQVDWGDGSGISWTAFGEGATSVQLSHTWTSSAEFDTVFTARCIEHQDVEQSGHWTMFVNPEVVSDRSLSGPSSGVSGMSYDYTLTAQSASGHSMQYQVYWGHGDGPGEEEWFDINPANGTAALSHSWPIDGADHNYQVDYGVRCKTHNDVQEWASIWVSIPGETITNHTLDGPTEGLVGVDYDFTVTGVSPGGHSLEYKFEWGDGFPTDWAALNGGTAGESYHWAFPGEFTVKASVRCATHNHVLSEKEQLVTITSDTPPGWIFGDGFESGNLEAW
jgi:hypothetical protein